MYYQARYYQPSIGRFTQADTIIPNPQDSQDYNRYMYVRGNPVGFSDPTGHCRTCLRIEGAELPRGQLPEEAVHEMCNQGAWGNFWIGVANLIPHTVETTLNLPKFFLDPFDVIPYIDIPDIPVDEGYEGWALAGEITASVAVAGVFGLRGVVAEGAAGGSATANATRALTVEEQRAFSAARSIYDSSELGNLRAAYEAGTAAEITVDGVVVVYEPGMSASGMTMFGEGGFVLGPEAFSSETELAATILHESHRLTTSMSAAGVTGPLVTAETNAAHEFAKEMYRVLIGE